MMKEKNVINKILIDRDCFISDVNFNNVNIIISPLNPARASLVQLARDTLGKEYQNLFK